MSGSSQGPPPVVLALRPRTAKWMILVTSLAVSAFLPVGEGHLVTPVMVFDYEPQTIWDAAASCVAKKGYLPELANVDDVTLFTKELHNSPPISGKDASTFPYSTAITRWNDVLNGIDVFYKYPIPSSGFKDYVPIKDTKLWLSNNGGPDNGGGNQYFIIYLGGQLNDYVDPVGTGLLKSFGPRKLACSLDATPGYCFQPPLKASDPFDVHVDDASATKQPADATPTYTYGTNATYMCPVGFVFEHTVIAGAPSRKQQVTCFGYIGWAERPVDMNCVPNPLEKTFTVAGLTFQALQANSSTIGSTKASISFFEAARLCNGYSGNDTGLADLPMSDMMDANGDRVPDPQLLEVLTSWSRLLNQTIALGTNIRYFDPAQYADPTERQAAFQKEWHRKVDPTGFKFLEEPSIAGTWAPSCLVFDYNNATSQGVMAANCTIGAVLANSAVLCQSGEGVCDTATTEPVPIVRPMAPADSNTMTTATKPQPFGATLTLACGCPMVFNDTKNRTRPIRCFGSLGWTPDPLPTCVQASLTTTLSTGQIVSLVNVTSTTSINHTTAAQLCNASATTGVAKTNTGTPTRAGLLELTSNDKDAAVIKKLMEDHCLTDAEIPVANNVVQNFAGSASINPTALSGTWGQTFPYLRTLWNLGDIAYTDVNSPPLCAAINASVNPTEVRLAAKSCDNALHTYRLLCQADKDVCLVPPPMSSLVVNYTGGLALDAAKYPFGTVATHRCACSQTWNGSGSEYFSPQLQCYGSFGWYPRLNDTCQGMQYLEVGSLNLTLVEAPFGIEQGAQICFSNFSGAVFEPRSLNASKAVMGALAGRGCLKTQTGKAYYIVYWAPTAWVYKELLPLDEVPTASEVKALWRYSDGSSFTADIFQPGEPQNFAGTEQCLVTTTDRRTGFGFDFNCFSSDGAVPVLCQQRAPEQMTSCPLEPRNPTANQTLVAVLKYIPAAARAPFPFGTVAQFECPCGFQWSYVSNWTNGFLPTTRTSLVNATCLGTLGWGTYDVTYCIPQKETTSAPLKSALGAGTAFLTFGNFSGNHTDEALRANSTEGRSLLRIESQADLDKVNALLNSWPCAAGDIPLANNILRYFKQVQDKVLTFTKAWEQDAVNATFWLIGEPSERQACAVLRAQSNGVPRKWMIAVKNCSAPSVSNVRLTIKATTEKGYGGAPIGTNCSMVAPNASNVVAFSDGQTTGKSWEFGTTITHRCPCGQVVVNTTNIFEIRESKCYSSLGWIPWDIPSCEQVSTSFALNGVNYTLDDGNSISEVGIASAMKQCRRSSNNAGTIAEIVSVDQYSRMTDMLKIHCVPHAFLAPTSWNYVQLARPNAAPNTSADFNLRWRYANGQNMSESVWRVVFFPGQPNNIGGRQMCLRPHPAATTSPAGNLFDDECWSPGSYNSSHFCATPGNATVKINTRCAAPWNPTWNDSVPALSTFPSGKTDAAYGTKFEMTCPDGYTWANVTKWATDDANHSSPPFGIRSPKVTVECLGSLGWTMYSVTECILATSCGAPAATSYPDVNSVCDLSTTGVYQCAHTCKDSRLSWLSGATQQNIKCHNSSNKWTTYNDRCGLLGCEKTQIVNFAGVNRLWPNESTTVGSKVTYSCPDKTSFNGSKAGLNASVEVTCQSNYTWANLQSNLTCKDVSWCAEAELPAVSNGVAKTRNGSNWIGDTVTMTFNDRIEVYTCTTSGNWSKDILSKPCSQPAPVPANVSSSCSADASGNLQVCNHTCKNSSHVWKSGTSFYQISCQANGTWTSYSDACIVGGIVCNTSDPKTFSGVTLNWSGNRTVNTEAVYRCASNRESFDGKKISLNQTLTIRCSADGSWLPATTSVQCQTVSWCDETLVQFNASEATKQKFGANWIGDRVVLAYSNRIETYFCLENGEWNKSIQAKCASRPAVPQDATSVCDAVPYGVQCNHTCTNQTAWRSGLAFQTVTCNYTQDNWTSYDDRCVRNTTCDGSLIRNFAGVSLNWTGAVKDGTVATYSCTPNCSLYNQTGFAYPNATTSVECLSTGNWSYVHAYLNCTPLPVCNTSALPPASFGVNRVANGSDQVGDTFSYFFADRTEIYRCLESGNWQFEVMAKGFPERIPVPTLPSYPVDFVETTLYHWGRAVENATCTGCLTGNISAPIESPGPTQFGQGVEIRGWDNECLEDNDFERRANFTCFANPMTCANGSNGISMGFFYKRGIPMKDVYLVYFNPKNSSANYPTKETLVSSGGDREGHPGIHVWWEGPFLGVLVSTGELYWEVLFLPKLFNDTWNNIGFRWFRPTPGVDDDGRLEVLINVEQQAATNQAKRASRVQSMLLPPTMLMGCHKDSTNTQKRFYGEGFFDEVAFWDTFIFDNTSRMFAGGYLPELNGVPTSVILDSIRESAKLEDERTRQVAWIAVQSIASDTNMTSEPVRPADAALNKTGETPSQQVENLVKFVTTLQSAEYISSSNSIGAVAKAARTSMSATSTLLSGNRHAWEEIADAGYKPGAYALVKSQNDYFMNMADSIAVDTKMTSAQMIDVTSDEIVSKLGVARIGHLRQSPTLKFPNYEDEIWGNGSMSKKFDYPVDTIEVPLGLYFPSSKTCDGTNLVNIEMNAYKNLDDFMPPNKVNPLKIVSQDNVIDSNILYFAFTLNKNIPKAKVAGCQPDALAMISNPIKLLFRHKMDEPAQEAGFKSRKLKFHTEEVEYNIKVRRCVWWNPSMNEFGGWDPSGCNIYDTADNFTMCECAAQGLFGILGEMIQHYELPTEPTWLTVVKFVGYGLSILCLPLFIVIVLKSKDHLHDQFHIMRANLAFALLVGLILHCISDLHSIRDSRHACTAISVMFHYFYTAAGAWFCFESYASFVAITQGIIGGKLRAYIPLCWGLPFLSVGAALIQDMLSYGTDPRCMISFDNEMKWIFFGPLLTFASIGFLLSAIVICNISTPALRKDHIADELVSVGQGLAAQVTYFLCTWIAGVCAYFIYDWTIETPGFYALFQVLNAYTGVFYLVFMGFISLRFRMVVLGVAQKRKLMILQYLTRNQHEQLKPTPSVDNQQSDELPDELFAEGGPSSGRRKILTST